MRHALQDGVHKTASLHRVWACCCQQIVVEHFGEKFKKPATCTCVVGVQAVPLLADRQPEDCATKASTQIATTHHVARTAWNMMRWIYKTLSHQFFTA